MVFLGDELLFGMIYVSGVGEKELYGAQKERESGIEYGYFN